MDREYYMKIALELAESAAEAREIPVGCVIVDENGEIIGKGHNIRESTRNALGHAELMAISQACQQKRDWRLDNCTIFVTLEPCPMCAGAIINARIPCVVFGARDESFGSCGSVIDLFTERYGHHPSVYGGVLEKECAEIIREFFKKIRN